MATFAEVLHLAADELLTTQDEPDTGERNVFSCCAISAAYAALTHTPYESWKNPVRNWYGDNFLPCRESFSLFLEEPNSQELRYANLKFAALIAEEEGL
jgi:hypothetical protein